MFLLALLLMVSLIGSALCLLAARDERRDDDVEYVYVLVDDAPAGAAR